MYHNGTHLVMELELSPEDVAEMVPVFAAVHGWHQNKPHTVEEYAEIVVKRFLLDSVKAGVADAAAEQARQAKVDELELRFNADGEF